MKALRLAPIVIGFLADALLGDPHGWPHPVRLVGKQIEFEEGLIRDYLVPEAEAAGDAWPLDRAQTERLAGAALAADVALLSPLVVHFGLKACGKLHLGLRFAAEAMLCYQLVASRSLRDESSKVRDALVGGDVEAARKAAAMIVGRDTENLDEACLARAAVETVAENTSDGVVAPLLFMGAGGPAAAMLYKAVNTLDSMVGYRNERYGNLGRAGAKLDDALSFAPARVTGVFMCAAAGIAGLDAKDAWRIFKRDRLNHASPNAGHAEAACAGALGVQLGGSSSYFGKEVAKPTIGDAARPIEVADIDRANRIMQVTAVLGLGAALLLAVLRPSR